MEEFGGTNKGGRGLLRGAYKLFPRMGGDFLFIFSHLLFREASELGI